ARRSHGNGSELAFRRSRNDGDQDLRSSFGLAELDFHTPKRRRRARRAEPLRPARATGLQLDEDVTMAAELYDKIPNNVNLGEDRRLQRALETWQPDFLRWWLEMGPSGSQNDSFYLGRGISVGPSGWPHFDYVRMPEYRWGIFLVPPAPDKKISFGDFEGQPVWTEVPGELRNWLRRIVVTQGDTEP